MLTTQAWNAFLKTLEEPPPNTIFVLATTEANKVLPTVVDRCHRFDFARPSVPQIAAVLRAGGRPRGDRDPRRGDRADRPLGDGLVPRRAGHARAAAGLLGQARSRSTTCWPCSAPPTPTSCSAPSTRSPPGDQREALLAAARLAESGRDLGRFFSDLEAHARGLMVVQTLGEVPAELRVTRRAGRAAGRAGAPRRARAAVVRLLELIADALRAMKDGADARTQLELALLKAATPAYDPTVKALLARIERLEGRAGRARPPAAAPALAAARHRRGRAAAPATPRGAAPPWRSPRRSRASRRSPRPRRCRAPRTAGQAEATRARRARPPPRSPPSSRRGRSGAGRRRRRGRRARRAGARGDVLRRRRAVPGGARRAVAGRAREPRRGRADARRRAPRARGRPASATAS